MAKVFKYHKDNQNHCPSWYVHLCDWVCISELGLYIIFSISDYN